MSDDMINILGIGGLACLFWFLQIYLPKRKLKKPGELQIRSIMNADEREMNDVVHSLFSSSYIIMNNVSLHDLLYSPSLSKKAYFQKAMKERRVSWLIMDKKNMPVLALDFATPDDEVKLACLTNAGIPCCILEPGTIREQIVEELIQAAHECSLVVEQEIILTPTPVAA